MLATSALTASGMAARSSGFDPACGGACAADLQTRWHTVTAEASQPHASSGSSGSPNTPAAAQRTATITPTAGSAAAHGAAAAAADAAAADAATTAGDSLAPPPPAPHHDPAALQRRVHSFLVCVSASPLVQSALLSLEVEEGGHPPAAGAPDASAAAAGCLEWTLAQLLALHLRAGYERASESSLLAALWTLESLHSAWRSSATAVLSSYVRLLAAFSPELVRRVTQDWSASFQKLRSCMAAAQLDLLQRLGWRALLRFDAEVVPCHALVAQLEDVCAIIRAQAAALKQAAAAQAAQAQAAQAQAQTAEGGCQADGSQASTASRASTEPGRSPASPGAKRRRTRSP